MLVDDQPCLLADLVVPVHKDMYRGHAPGACMRACMRTCRKHMHKDVHKDMHEDMHSSA